MKRLSLLAALFILNFWVANAQMKGYPTVYTEYSETLQQEVPDEAPDKTCTNLWTEYFHTKDGKSGKIKYVATLAGCTLDGKQYTKVIVGEKDTLLYRQEGDRVYMLRDGHEALILDYGLEVGDEFEGSDGMKFIVTKKEECAPRTSYHGAWKKSIALYRGEQPSKILHLESVEDATCEDEWMEGIGSVEWGIVPRSVLKTMVASDEVDRTHLIGGSTMAMYALFEVTEQDYAAIPFEPVWKEYTTSYSFSADTLCVRDYLLFGPKNYTAECTIGENVIDIQIDNGSKANAASYGGFELRIPKVKPGTYDVYINGRLRGEGLVCNGAPEAVYHPFIEEGKVWKVGRFPGLSNTATEVLFYSIQGDTVIAGKEYKRWICRSIEEQSEQITYFGAVREENRRVFLIPERQDTEYLLYDFGAEVGETIEVFDCYEGKGTVKALIKEKYEEDHLGYKLFHTRLATQAPGSDTFTESADWIEGLGVFGLPWYSVRQMPGYYYATFYCQSGSGEYLYKDENLTDGIQQMSNAVCKMPDALYDLTGRRIGQPQRGLYIQNGKKIVVR